MIDIYLMKQAEPEKPLKSREQDHYLNMKKLNLECLEVEELDARECGALNGGISPWVGFVAAYVLVEAALNPRAHAKAFMEGWNSI